LLDRRRRGRSRHARWLALLGNHAYDVAIWLNTYCNGIRRFSA
jgi:hypothetical protein